MSNTDLNRAEAWHVLMDPTGEELILHQGGKYSGTGIERRKNKFKEIAVIKSEEDALFFLQCKQLGMAPDALAYLKCEHDVRASLTEDPITKDEAFCAMTEKVKADSGRTCFGKCRSLEKAPACAICYEAKNETWALCARIRCLSES